MEKIKPTSPGVVLAGAPSPYVFTGVVNRAWIDATRIVGRRYTPREIEGGWPMGIEPHRLACLQFPQDPTGQDYINTALLAACKTAQLPCTAYEHHDYAPLQNGGRQLIEVWMDYAITAPTFAAWLARQGEEPSPHIAAWFKATGVAPAAAPPPPAPVPAPTARRPRNDLLAPLIVKAQGQSTDPTATAAVFAILRSWAEHKPAMPPLVGVTEDGRIQWRDSSDRPQELTLQALGKRLKRRA